MGNPYDIDEILMFFDGFWEVSGPKSRENDAKQGPTCFAKGLENKVLEQSGPRSLRASSSTPGVPRTSFTRAWPGSLRTVSARNQAFSLFFFGTFL